MLYLLFQIGSDRYALEAGEAVEVLPLVGLKQVPQAAPGVAGIFNYRGEPVPAIDLSELTVGRPAQERLSTRIIVVDYTGAAGQRGRLGLIAERTTELMRREARDFVESGVKVGGAPYLGPVLMDGRGIIQLLHGAGLAKLAEKAGELLPGEAAG